MNPNTCKTVAIQGEPSAANPSGVVVINESDFDETTMTLYVAPEEKLEETGKTLDPKVPSPTKDATAKVVAPWASK